MLCIKDGIIGTIPTELGALALLTKLILGSNVLSGSIPREIGNLLLLSILDLSQNFLVGTICSEIGLLTALTLLNLADNLFAGTVPSTICNLMKMQFISFCDTYRVGCPLLTAVPRCPFSNVLQNLFGDLPYYELEPPTPLSAPTMSPSSAPLTTLTPLFDSYTVLLIITVPTVVSFFLLLACVICRAHIIRAQQLADEAREEARIEGIDMLIPESDSEVDSHSRGSSTNSSVAMTTSVTSRTYTDLSSPSPMPSPTRRVSNVENPEL